MDETQQLEVLEALQAAAWLGEMAVTQLTATTSASQTTPEFQQFFGTYDGDRRRILLGMTISSCRMYLLTRKQKTQQDDSRTS